MNQPSWSLYYLYSCKTGRTHTRDVLNQALPPICFAYGSKVIQEIVRAEEGEPGDEASHTYIAPSHPSTKLCWSQGVGKRVDTGDGGMLVQQ